MADGIEDMDINLWVPRPSAVFLKYFSISSYVISILFWGLPSFLLSYIYIYIIYIYIHARVTMCISYKMGEDWSSLVIPSGDPSDQISAA